MGRLLDRPVLVLHRKSYTEINQLLIKGDADIALLSTGAYCVYGKKEDLQLLVMLTWMPIYLLQVKGFSKAEMAVAFLFFEWAAIPSTIFAGYISDKFFKGYRMSLQ